MRVSPIVLGWGVTWKGGTAETRKEEQSGLRLVLRGVRRHIPLPPLPSLVITQPPGSTS